MEMLTIVLPREATKINVKKTSHIVRAISKTWSDFVATLMVTHLLPSTPEECP